jgi:hypothetical protein
MRPVIHEFLSHDVEPCGNWHDGDGLTAVADAVTCPECRKRRENPNLCPSRRAKDGKRCAGRRGHDGLHHAEAYDVLYFWTDDDSPELPTDLLRAR